MKRRRKGWYKKAKLKWFDERVTSFTVGYGGQSYRFKKGVKVSVSHGGSMNDVMYFLWHNCNNSEAFFFAWSKRLVDIESGRVSVKYETGEHVFTK